MLPKALMALCALGGVRALQDSQADTPLSQPTLTVREQASFSDMLNISWTAIDNSVLDSLPSPATRLLFAASIDGRSPSFLNVSAETSDTWIELPLTESGNWSVQLALETEQDGLLRSAFSDAVSYADMPHVNVSLQFNSNDETVNLTVAPLASAVVPSPRNVEVTLERTYASHVSEVVMDLLPGESVSFAAAHVRLPPEDSLAGVWRIKKVRVWHGVVASFDVDVGTLPHAELDLTPPMLSMNQVTFEWLTTDAVPETTQMVSDSIKVTVPAAALSAGVTDLHLAIEPNTAVDPDATGRQTLQFGNVPGNSIGIMDTTLFGGCVDLHVLPTGTVPSKASDDSPVTLRAPPTAETLVKSVCLRQLVQVPKPTFAFTPNDALVVTVDFESDPYSKYSAISEGLLNKAIAQVVVVIPENGGSSMNYTTKHTSLSELATGFTIPGFTSNDCISALYVQVLEFGSSYGAGEQLISSRNAVFDVTVNDDKSITYGGNAIRCASGVSQQENLPALTLRSVDHNTINATSTGTELSQGDNVLAFRTNWRAQLKNNRLFYTADESYSSLGALTAEVNGLATECKLFVASSIVLGRKFVADAWYCFGPEPFSFFNGELKVEARNKGDNVHLSYEMLRSSAAVQFVRSDVWSPSIEWLGAGTTVALPASDSEVPSFQFLKDNRYRLKSDIVTQNSPMFTEVVDLPLRIGGIGGAKFVRPVALSRSNEVQALVSYKAPNYIEGYASQELTSSAQLTVRVESNTRNVGAAFMRDQGKQVFVLPRAVGGSLASFDKIESVVSFTRSLSEMITTTKCFNMSFTLNHAGNDPSTTLQAYATQVSDPTELCVLDDFFQQWDGEKRVLFRLRVPPAVYVGLNGAKPELAEFDLMDLIKADVAALYPSQVPEVADALKIVHMTIDAEQEPHVVLVELQFEKTASLPVPRVVADDFAVLLANPGDGRLADDAVTVLGFVDRSYDGLGSSTNTDAPYGSEKQRPEPDKIEDKGFPLWVLGIIIPLVLLLCGGAVYYFKFREGNKNVVEMANFEAGDDEDIA
ncbi:MAG: hypothetical protein MHM6MM_005012 [Cercozoa sp. M6MM]